jgi:hypothetical protein
MVDFSLAAVLKPAASLVDGSLGTIVFAHPVNSGCPLFGAAAPAWRRRRTRRRAGLREQIGSGRTGVAVADPATSRALLNVQSLAGFITTDKGRHLVFDLSMSGATYPDVLTGLQQANDDVGMVAADIQQSLSK